MSTSPELANEQGAPDLSKARALFQKHWGHDDFKPTQAEALGYTFQGHDVLAVLATGFGKSILFQLPPIVLGGVSIVISPLIALMKDQADDCVARGIPASFVNSHLTDDEIEARFAGLAANKFRVFYVAPERIDTPKFKQALSKAKVVLIAVDEAHCVSRLGHDFRPAYQRIQTLANFLTIGDQRPPILAVTATATKEIEDDIGVGCGMMPGYKRIVGDPTRHNLKYLVWSGNPWRNLEHAVKAFDVKTGRYVIYGGTRKGCERIVEVIRAEHPDIPSDSIAFYHAGMNKEQRTLVQDGFKSGKVPIVVATTAFGMGIDVPNIRAVLHFGISSCIEDYVQESGRAGRDGKPSEVILICEGRNDFSVRMQQRFIEANNPPYGVYADLWKWLHATLDPGAILTLSGTSIAEELLASGYVAGAKSLQMNQNNITDAAKEMLGSQVLGALSTMEAYGLVRRGSQESETTNLEVNAAELETILPECTGTGKKIGEYLAHEIKEFLLTEAAWTEACKGGAMCLVRVDRAEVAAQLEISEAALQRTLKAFAGADVLKIGKVYKGKTTQIIMHGVDLEEVLPKAKIEEKRKRSFDRLESMLRYMEAKNKWAGDRKTDEAYRDYLRKYFLTT